MPRKQANLQVAARANKQAAVMPEPPADLWAQMDALNQRHKMPTLIEQPPGTFTALQYGKRYGISRSHAKARLTRLAELGELELVGIGLCNVHYYRIK